MQLRCHGNKVHGETVDECSGILEVYCDSRWCGKNAKTVVVHRFDLATGDLTTRLFKKPVQPTPEVIHAP